jgi:hypothetical protein
MSTQKSTPRDAIRNPGTSDNRDKLNVTKALLPLWQEKKKHADSSINDLSAVSQDLETAQDAAKQLPDIKDDRLKGTIIMKIGLAQAVLERHQKNQDLDAKRAQDFINTLNDTPSDMRVSDLLRLLNKDSLESHQTREQEEQAALKVVPKSGTSLKVRMNSRVIPEDSDDEEIPAPPPQKASRSKVCTLLNTTIEGQLTYLQAKVASSNNKPRTVNNVATTAPRRAPKPDRTAPKVRKPLAQPRSPRKLLPTRWI